MPAIASPLPAPSARLSRLQRLLLLLAFEVLVFGAAQAWQHPVRRAGILIETTVTPNHVVT